MSMYEYTEIKDLLSPNVAKLLAPVITPGVDGGDPTTDLSKYDSFAEKAESLMSAEYASNIRGRISEKWVQVVYAYTLDFVATSSLAGISADLQKKVRDNYDYAVGLLHQNRITTANVKSKVGHIADAYEN